MMGERDDLYTAVSMQQYTVYSIHYRIMYCTLNIRVLCLNPITKHITPPPPVDFQNNLKTAFILLLQRVFVKYKDKFFNSSQLYEGKDLPLES